jgi:electron transport complex protein RnfG
MLAAIRKNGLMLALFACATTGLVAVTHALTEQQIAHQQKAQLLSVLDQVIPVASHDNDLAKSCIAVSLPYLKTSEPLYAYIAQQQQEPVGLAIETIAPDGYNGAIKLIVGIDNQGVVTGTRVLSQQETPGLGDKIDLRVTDWILSFSGKQLTEENQSTWAVRKDGGQFDQFTGATITPRAVVKAVRNVLEYVNQHRDELYRQPMGCEEK